MVKSDLLAFGIHGMTVYEVRGFGRQKGQSEIYSGSEYLVDFVPKLKLEVLIADSDVDAVVEMIAKAAWTGRIGDGKVYVTDLDTVVRIRTGERDEDAV
jgi:nitrogen regulatory protein P-II 1